MFLLDTCSGYSRRVGRQIANHGSSTFAQRRFFAQAPSRYTAWAPQRLAMATVAQSDSSSDASQSAESGSAALQHVETGSAASQRADTLALPELNQRSAGLGVWHVGIFRPAIYQYTWVVKSTGRKKTAQ